MARETNTRKTQRTEASLTTEAPRLRPTTRYLNVSARSGAADAAEAMGRAFGFASDAYVDHRDRQHEEGFEQAIIDRAEGDLDPEQLERNKGYQKAWSQLDARDDTLRVASGLQEHLRTKDFENMEEAEVRAEMKAYFDAQLGGAEQDPDYAKALAPAILSLEESTIEAHRNLKIAGVKAEQETKIYSTAAAGFAAAQTDEDYRMVHAQFNEDVNTFFDADERRAAEQKFFRDAAERGDERIFDTAPDKYASGAPTMKTDARTREEFKELRETARQNRLDDQAEEETIGRADTVVAFTNAADSGALDVDELDRLTMRDPPMFTEAQNVSLKLRNSAAKLTANNAAYAISTWDAREVDRLGGFSKAEQEAIGTQAIVKVAEEHGPEKAQAYGIDSSAENGVVAGIHKDTLGGSQSSPRRFRQAVELYNGYVSRGHEDFINGEVDSDQLARFREYNNLMSTMGDPENPDGSHDAVMERLDNYEPKLAAEWSRDNVREAVTSAITETTDRKGILSFGNADDNGTIRQYVRQRTERYLGYNMNPKEAAKLGAKDAQKQFVMVDGQLHNRNAGWSKDPEADIEFAKAIFADAHGVDEDSVTVRPIAGRPGQVIVSSVEVGGGGNDPMNIADLASGRMAALTNERIRRRRNADRESYEKAKDAAIKEVVPSKYRHNLEAREWYWNSLPEGERNAALERHQSRLEAERADADARNERRRSSRGNLNR